MGGRDPCDNPQRYRQWVVAVAGHTKAQTSKSARDEAPSPEVDELGGRGVGDRARRGWNPRPTSKCPTLPNTETPSPRTLAGAVEECEGKVGSTSDSTSRCSPTTSSWGSTGSGVGTTDGSGGGVSR